MISEPAAIISYQMFARGSAKRVVIGPYKKNTAVLTNVDEGVAVTVLDHIKIMSFRVICKEHIDTDLVYFILESLGGDSDVFVEWINTASTEDFERYRMMYALSDHK